MPQWRRTLYILFTVQLLSVAGFGLVFPFLSLYVAEVGVATSGSIEFWSGLVFSSQAFTMMLSAPVWGVIADRYGRKMMLTRATLGGAVLLALMGFAQNAEQLVILRTIQGAVTGVLAATNALAAATAPPEKSGEALGLMQMARWVGIAAGPVIGGVLGDAFGFRESFWITSIILGTAGVAVVFWVDEEFTPQSKASRPTFFGSYHRLFIAPGMSGLYGLTFLRSLGQTLIFPFAALFMAQLTGSNQGAALITGLMIGAASISGAFSSVWLGRMGDRIGHNRIMVVSALIATLFYLPQPFVTAPWQLIALQALTGAAVGGMMPSVAAMMNLWTPSGTQGATYGLENSVTAAARAIAPMVGAAIAVQFGLRGVFGAGVVVFGVTAALALLVGRRAEQRAMSGRVAADS